MYELLITTRAVAKTPFHIVVWFNVAWLAVVDVVCTLQKIPAPHIQLISRCGFWLAVERWTEIVNNYEMP